MFEGKTERAVGWAIDSERSMGGQQVVVKAPCGERLLMSGCQMFDEVGVGWGGGDGGQYAEAGSGSADPLRTTQPCPRKERDRQLPLIQCARGPDIIRGLVLRCDVSQ